MWIIYVAYQASSQCCYRGNFMLYRGPLEFPRRTLTAKLRKRPDDVRSWAEDIIRDVISDVANNACKELADDYDACGIVPGIIYTSEVLVPEAEKKVAVPEVVPPVVEVPVPPVEIPVVEVTIPHEVIEAIKGLEKTIKSLREGAERFKAIPDLQEDLLKRADELQKQVDSMREKYGLIGKEL